MKIMGNGVKFYATPTGKRYHRFEHCEGLNSAVMAAGRVPTVSMAVAARRGLTPCATCQPPPLLRVVA